MALAMLGAFASTHAVALGLGEIELNSSLNQPFDAELQLLSATDADLEGLKVQIGSAEAFSKAGIDRPFFLNKLKFEVMRKADGTAVVRVTSHDVVREPFLDFLLELSWSKGRLLREYTVLVDPPVTMPAPAPVTQAPQAIAAPPRRVSHAAELPPVSVAPGEYGPIRRNETLWNIALQVRPGTDISIEQTMQGLLRANPEAFIANNINDLKMGYVLRVPSREELTSVSRSEAARESRAQYSTWRAARTPMVAEAFPEMGSTTELAEASAESAEIATSVESNLQLVAPEEAGGSGVDEGMLADAQRELIMANEALEEERRQSEEKTERLSMLEEQIVNMQRLLQLKDDELAQLQFQAGAEVLETTEGELAADIEVLAEGIDSDETALVDESGIADEMLLAEDASMIDVESLPAEGEIIDEMPGDEMAMIEPEPEFESEPELEPEPALVEPPVAVAPPATPPPPPGFIERLLDNPLWLGGGGVVLALLAFFGLRRKRGVETEFQESILQASQGDSSIADSEIVSTKPNPSEGRRAESSLLSEFAVSDMGSLKGDGAADPLAEADVYLAYGRFQQAEDLIRDGLEKESGREDLNLKLLEVFLAGKNETAFDEHAQTMLAKLENTGLPLWEKIAEMGRELSPENPLYQAEAAPEANNGLDDIEALSEDLDFNLDGDSDVPPTVGSGEDDEGLDFDIDLSFESAKEDESNSVEPTADEPTEMGIDMDSVEPDIVSQEGSLDIDLKDFEMETDDAVAEDDIQGDGELADLDEVSTKLDLARAYIDMGDPDGAKSILDEVMDEGSEEQKDEARNILGQMA